MPTTQQHTRPDVFLEYKGVTIYHAYDDGDYDSPYDYRFSTSEDGADDNADKCQFDARDLPDFDANDHPPFLNGADRTEANMALWDNWHKTGQQEVQFKRAMELAIDKGFLQEGAEVDFDAVKPIDTFRSHLQAFLTSAKELNTAWLAVNESVGSHLYPFEQDFGELIPLIQNWVDNTNLAEDNNARPLVVVSRVELIKQLTAFIDVATIVSMHYDGEDHIGSLCFEIEASQELLSQTGSVNPN